MSVELLNIQDILIILRYIILKLFFFPEGLKNGMGYTELAKALNTGSI